MREGKCGLGIVMEKCGAGTNTRLSAAACRALAEAEERRRTAQAVRALKRVLNGRAGPEPVRYGDWEKNGIAVDF